MSKPLIAVTGRNGQLGRELAHLADAYINDFDFLFTGREELDLGNPAGIPSFFTEYKPAYFINCAAFTAVDKAETEQEAAYILNAESVGILAQQCSTNQCTLIGISTDYVFDGNGSQPYLTTDTPDPINYYGYTKWLGEKLALENNERTIIIRTSWLYSEYGNNFVKTMLRLMNEKSEVKVVYDQLGSPTYAADLADAILKIIVSLEKGNGQYGIYQYSNMGVISWYDFATAIKNIAGLPCEILPIPGSAYATPANRPAYSVMDTMAIVKDFGIEIKDWKQSLETCVGKLL